MNFQLIKKDVWHFPPTLNRKGGSKYLTDIKTIFYLESDTFPHKVIMTSDLHSHSIALFTKLEKVLGKEELSEYHLITAGDMSGELVRGSDGDSTPFYKGILPKIKSFYLIQGNHDLPPPNSNDLKKMLINKDGSNAYLENGKCQKTSYGIIGGVHGTISNKTHPYKMPEEEYYKLIKKFQSFKNHPDILITHETPRFFQDKEEFIGKDELYTEVLKIKPKMYLYGHCHQPKFHTSHNNIDFFNLDGRVLIWNAKKNEI